MVRETRVVERGRDGIRLGGSRARARSEPGRSAYLPPEPLGVVAMGRGFHCVVRVKVGSVSFRVTIDTGSARNLIRSSFAEKLRVNAKTRDAVVGRGRADKVINCTGICADMESSVLEFVSTVQCMFESVADGRGLPATSTVEVPFAELDNASDCLLIGFPTLADWGLRLDKDADENVWLELVTLGVTLLAERPPADDF